jgi:hypothetical protein
MGKLPATHAASPPAIEGWPKLLVSACLGGFIAGLFGLAHDWSGRDQQRCALAMQFLGDETPSPALSVPDRQRLAAEAHSRLLRCLGDD